HGRPGRTERRSRSRPARSPAGTAATPVCRLPPRAAVNRARRTSETPGADDAPEQPHAEDPGKGEADDRDHVDAEHLRPRLREDPDQARADQTAGSDERDHEPVGERVELVKEIVEPLVDEAD